MSNVSKTTTDKKLLRLPTKIATFQDVEKALKDITLAYNKLVESTNADGEAEITNKDGKTGDVRVTRNKDKTYKLEIKSEEGWKFGEVPNHLGGTSVVKYVDSSRLDKPEPTPNERIAERGYVLPRPDYDSGWQTWTRNSHSGSGNTPLKVEHGLGALPSMMIGYYAPDQSPSSVTWFSAIKNDRGYGYDNGIGMYVDNARAYFWGGDGNSLVGVPAPSTTSNCGAATFDNGSVKVLLWK